MSSAPSVADAGPSKIIRRTQRAPASCTACTKRKAKCSRTIPCVQCITRGQALQCRREVVLVRGITLRNGTSQGTPEGRDITVESLVEENARLRAEISLLRGQGGHPAGDAAQSQDGLPQGEGERHHDEEDKSIVATGSTSYVRSTNELPIRQPIENDLERMATLTNLLEMGRTGGAQDVADSIYGVPDAGRMRSPLDSWLQSDLPTPWLPDNIIAMEMMQYCADQLGWLYLSCNGPSTLERLRSYLIRTAQDGLSCFGMAWYAFYLSMLVLAVHFAPPNLRQRWDLAGNSAETAKMWFDASIQVLMMSDFMSQPNTLSCHCICNLACVFHRYGPPVLGNVLLSAAVRIAQNLRMDQLSDNAWCEPDRPDLMPCSLHGAIPPHIIVSPNLVEREARRRLWWFLIYRDWISFPAGYRYVIASELLTLQVPLNIDDGQLDVGEAAVYVSPSTRLTDASFHVARSRLSHIMHAFFSTYRQLGRGDPARHQLAWDTDLRLGQLLQDTPFSPGSAIPADDSKPWYAAACHLFRSLIAHKRLLLFREFFALAFTDSRWREARQQCVLRAAEIVTIRRSFTQPLLGTSETASHYLAAALVLALDFVYFGVSSYTTADAESRQSQLEELVLALKNTETLEGNAGRMLNQVQLLQGLAIEMRTDLNTSTSVRLAAQSSCLDADNAACAALEPMGLSDDTTDWLDRLLQDLGSAEDPSLDSTFLSFTNPGPQPDKA